MGYILFCMNLAPLIDESGVFMDRKATVVWNGGVKTGAGKISTETGALLQVPYSYDGRFENKDTTNPEELIAAAHAACFSMALTGKLEKMGFFPQNIKTTSRVTLEKQSMDWKITEIHMDVEGSVGEIDQNQFFETVSEVKDTCPVSRLMNAPITFHAWLVANVIEKRAG